MGLIPPGVKSGAVSGTVGAALATAQNCRVSATRTPPEPAGPTLRRAGMSLLSQCSPPTTAPTIIPTTAPAGTVNK